MPIGCGVCNSTLTLVLTTDAFGFETTYTLGDAEGSLCFDDVYGGSGFSPYTTYTIDVSDALCDGMDYTFTLYDSWGDGICCAHGYGGYHLELDGRTIYTSDGDFNYADAYTFTAGGCAIDQEEVNWFLNFCMQTSRCTGIKPCDFNEVSPATTTEKATGDRNLPPLPETQSFERTKAGATDSKRFHFG